MQQVVSFFIKLFSDERVRFLSGLLCFAVAVLFLLSFVSFIFTWKHDASQLLNQSAFEFLFLGNTMQDPALQPTELAVNAEYNQPEIRNWGGRAGALLSKKFIHDWFGVSSFLFIYICVILALYAFNIKKNRIKKNLYISLLSLLVGSVTLGYVCNTLWDANFGGLFGYYISWHLLGNLLGAVPTGIIVFIVFFTYLFFTFKQSYPYLKNFVLELLHPQADSTIIDTADAEEELPDSATPDEELVEKLADSITEEEVVEDAESQDEKFISGIEFEVKSTIEPEETPATDESEETVATPLKEPIDEVAIMPGGEAEESQEQLTDENGDHIEVEDMDVTNTKNNSDEAEVISTELQDYDPTLDLEYYNLPTIDLLENHQASAHEVSTEELTENKNKIEQTLGNYGIQIVKISATIGPTITLYEIVPAPGVRISKIKSLEDDIALSLAALGIRIIAPIPGKGTIGIEVPNKQPEIVSMRSIIASKAFQDAKMDLPVALGKTISNEAYVFDLAKMPHLLVAGATGQGKSVGLNAIMTSLLYKKHPAQLKFVLVDPKKVELTLYQNIENHFLAKLPDDEEAIITDTQKVVNTLNSLCIEMDERYDLLKSAKLRNIKEYNERFISRRLNPNNGHRYLPYIVVVIDEFADLIITAGKEVEVPLARLAQLARAIGIHLIIATQRPAANIITGAIKANFPARLAFRVASGIDSRTILDATGANQLIGKGDLLITKGSELVRVQCAFVDTPEVEKLTNYISEQQSYGSPLLLPEFKGKESTGNDVDANELDTLDSMFEDAARMIVINQQGSTSLLQRKLKLGYNRAGRIMDQLEAYSVVGPFEGSKARQVLIPDEVSLEQLLSNLRDSGKL